MATFLNDSPIFGPVHSRRLGISLGVNLMPASGKICSFDCIYCENGTNSERRTTDSYLSAPVVLSALEARLASMADSSATPDVITFAGNGEPTASPAFPEAVAGAVELRDRFAPDAKIAVLSNGTRADIPAVHDALMQVDDNILKLDAVDPDLAAAIDRPVGPYDIQSHIHAFASFNGHCIVQTMFLHGYVDDKSVDNCGELQVSAWIEALKQIHPQAATIYTIARDTPISSISKATKDELDYIAERVRNEGIAVQVSY